MELTKVRSDTDIPPTSPTFLNCLVVRSTEVLYIVILALKAIRTRTAAIKVLAWV